MQPEDVGRDVEDGGSFNPESLLHHADSFGDNSRDGTALINFNHQMKEDEKF